jgi:hypothetical protein
MVAASFIGSSPLLVRIPLGVPDSLPFIHTRGGMCNTGMKIPPRVLDIPIGV